MKRLLWFDLETSGLFADWDSCYSIGFQVEKEPVTVISVHDFQHWKPWDDRAVIATFLKTMNREDIGRQVTHYGTRFDLPFLQARMLKNKQGYLPNVEHDDTYMIARARLKVKRKRLDSLGEFLGCKTRKTYLSPDIWRRAARGEIGCLDYIAKHCAADVKLLREVHTILSPLKRIRAAIGAYEACHNCGKHTLQRRGTATTVLKGQRWRFHCTSCGAWSTRAA
jgi:uncharacterized protein YprB with RNaseH-like and TPR domain